MSGLEGIQKIIENFVYESNQTKKQIAEIEKERTDLAQERNSKKSISKRNYEKEISVLGKKISELGIKSQELQNKLDSKFNETKKIVNLTIDNLITEGIRRVRKIDEEQHELEEKISLQKERNAKYETQKQEFFERFGRMPQLSENAQREDKIQDKQCLSYKTKIERLEQSISDMETELTKLAKIKRDFKNRCWTNVINFDKKEVTEDLEQITTNIEEEAIVLPLMEEIQVEEIEPIEYVEVEEFQPIQEIKIEELNIEPFDASVEFSETIENNNLDENIEMIKEEKEANNIQVNKIEESKNLQQVDEIQELARAIVEEIIAEQTKDINKSEIEEKNDEQEIITFEEKQEEVKVQKVEEKVTLLNIIAKIEDGEVMYKAQASNEEELKIYPTLEVRNVLLNDKECREEIKEILINYVVEEYKAWDNKVIKKIDPTVCYLLERFAQKYNYDARTLIYNYAMSFSKKDENETYDITPITYNFSYLKGTNLSKKEKTIISKICKNALKNEKIDIVGGVTGFSRIKYIFKRLFNANSVGALPEGKY